MSDAPYQLYTLFLTRLAGVPFDAIEGLATPECARQARALLALEAAARTAGNALLEASRARGETNEKLARRIDELKVTGGTGLGPPEQHYEQARSAWATARDALAPLLETELAAARRSLRQSAATHLPGFTVFTAELGDPELFGPRLQGELPPLNSKERQRERTYLMYLQRVAAKNDTISAWGPTAWGRMTDKGPAMTLEPVPGVAGRDVYLEKWVVNAVIAGMSADPEARLEMAPRLHSSGRLQEGGFFRVDSGELVALEPPLAALAARIDGVHPAHALGAVEQLQALVDKGVVLWEQNTVVLVAHRLEVVRGDVAAWRDGPARSRWLGVIDGLLDVSRDFAATEDPERRKELMSRGGELARALGAQAKDTSRTALYRGASPLSEDCVRAARITIGSQLTELVEKDARPWIDLWRDAYSHLAHVLAARLRPLVEETPKVDGKVLLPTFMRYCASRGHPIHSNGMLEMTAPAVDDVRKAFDEILRGKPEDAEEWTLSASECASVGERLGGKRIEEFTLPAVDFMVGGRSVEAINRGEYQVVIGELHAPIVTLQHCFSWGNPEPALFSQGLAACMDGVGAPQSMLHYGNVRVQATCHTSVDFHRAMPGRFEIASLERGLPGWPSVPASEIEVFVDADSGDVRTRTLDGRVLGSLARDWFVVWIAFHPFVFYRAPYLPRLKVGRCVVQRRTWLVERSEIADGRFEGTDAGLVVEVERLRARRGMPRWVFVRPVPTFFSKTLTGKDKDHKPVCLDLESYLSLEVLASWARKYPLLEVTEMLPDPDHLCWREASGKYTFELRALVVPQAKAGRS